MKTLFFFILILFLGAFTTGNNKRSNSPYLSPSYMAYDEKNKALYISLETAGKLMVYSTEKNKVIGEIPLKLNPAGLAISADGGTLYVAGKSNEGKLFVVDLFTKKIRKSISVGHTPLGIALSPNGERLYVANRFSDNVSVIDTRSLSEIKKIKVTREPVSVAISKDNNTVFVANHLPGGSSNVDYVSAVVSVISNKNMEVIKDIQLPNGSNALNDIAVSPDGVFIYVSHILARYQYLTTQLDKGWMNTNALSIIDVKKSSYYKTVLLDDVNKGAANPFGVSVSPDGEKIFVALSGSDELCIIDKKKLHHKIEKKEEEKDNSMYEISNDLGFIYEVRKRIKLDGKGFRHVMATNEGVFLTSYFTGSILCVDLAGKKIKNRISLGTETAKSQERLGEELFHDATRSFQGWQSCSSCHPGNARVDALNWDLLNDGIGNPKNTKSLLLSHVTPPAMITGIRADAETAVRAGIKHIQFAVRPEEEAQAIDAYLKSLKPVASPYLKNGKLSKKAKKGQRIFESAGCIHCHSGPYYTNMEKFNVGTGTDEKQNQRFDTPSLVEAWRTAPYLNDGRAATLEEVVTKFNKDGRHGITSELSEEQVNYLVEYLKSL